MLGTPQGYRGKDVIARSWDIVEAFEVNVFSARVPTLFAALLQQPVGMRNIASLEYAACGAAPMPLELARSFETATGVKIVEGYYGLTEGACVSSTNPLDGERRIGSIGLRLPYQQMIAVILDEAGSYAVDGKLSLDRFCALDHALVSYSGGNLSGVTDEALARAASRYR